MKFYKLDDAIKAGKLRTKGNTNILYVYPCPSINGLFVDWILEGIKYSDKTPTCTITNGKVQYNRE